MGLLFAVTIGDRPLVWAQANQWPEKLMLPAPPEPLDTHRVDITTRQSWYENTFTSKDNLTLCKTDSSYYIEQSAIYSLMVDTGLAKQNEYLALGGQFKRLHWPLQQTALGIDWRPQAVLNSGMSGSALLGIGEIGPTMDATIQTVPIKGRAGFVATAWNDSLPDRLVETDYKRFRSTTMTDAGVYGALTIGDFMQPIKGLPLYFNADGYGRVTDSTSRLIVTTGSLLFGQGFRSGDSLFLYYTDSLSSGQEGFLAEEKYINIAQKTARSFQAMGAFKGQTRLKTTPALIYSFSRYSVYYPAWQKLLNDKANAVHSLQALISIDTLWFLSYNGGMRWEWENEDKLYRDRSFGKTLTVDNGDSIRNNGDSITARLRDYDAFRVSMRHELVREWDNGVSVRYSYDVSRYTKRYPNIFFSNLPSLGEVDTFASNEDNHWIVAQHRLEFQPITRGKFELSLNGSFAKNTSIYLKKTRSADNATDRSYSVGITCTVRPVEKLELNGGVIALAKTTEFAFPFAHRDRNLDGRPDGEAQQSRNYSSKLTASWQISDRFSIATEWDEEYWDEGYWNGKEYFDSIPPGFQEVYAIDRKSLDWTVIASGTYNQDGRLKVQAGTECGDLYFRVYRGKAFGYDAEDLGVGIILAPFIKSSLHINSKIQGIVKVKYTNFNIFSDKLDSKQRNNLLDLDVKINATF
jgi:hypothetical protein